MRRMYSENQLKDVVNKGIQDGSVELPHPIIKDVGLEVIEDSDIYRLTFKVYGKFMPLYMALSLSTGASFQVYYDFTRNTYVASEGTIDAADFSDDDGFTEFTIDFLDQVDTSARISSFIIPYLCIKNF